MIIGVPRERKSGERRVGMTPFGVSELVKNGHSIIVEQNAGELSSYSNEEFLAAGAKIAPTLAEVWNNCELLVKVKEPAPEEVLFFRPGLAVFSFLHLAVAADLTKALVEKGTTGLDYDLVTTDEGRLVVLEPMSIIAGKLAAQCGAAVLQADKGGRGVLLGGTPAVSPAKVLVVGAGMAGKSAAIVAAGMGANVTLLDLNQAKLAAIQKDHPDIAVRLSNSATLDEEIANADLVIGAVLVPGALAPKVINRAHLNKMKKGAVIVDISIDQGGCAESSKPTTIADPTYVDSGIVHYCVTNMPALVPRTSTQALTAATLPWISMLANTGIENTLRSSAAMRRSLTNYKCKLTNAVIGKAIGLDAISDAELDSLLK